MEYYKSMYHDKFKFKIIGIKFNMLHYKVHTITYYA